MASDLAGILSLEVPIIVVLAERLMHVNDITSLVPGAVIELSKSADDELSLLVNNKQIGTGTAVKVGENFGIRISYIGDLHERINALAPEAAPIEDMDAAALAEQMLAGQV
jgi:flagellar motor switch protein FliN